MTAAASVSAAERPGVAESRFYLAFEHASRLFDYCGSLHPCGGKPSCKELQMCGLGMLERMYVVEAAHQAGQELPAPRNIEFVSGREKPGFFQIDGWHKIARTGSAPGDVIHVNRDEIYRPDGLGGREPLSYLEILEIVVHERIHHTGSGGRMEGLNDEIAQKITAVAQKFAYSATLGPGAENIRFTVLNSSDRALPLFDVPGEYLLTGLMTVEDGEKVITIEDGLRLGIEHRRPKLPAGFRIQTVQAFNVHWENPPMPAPRDRKTTVRLVGTAVVHGIAALDRKKKPVPATYSFRFAYDFGVEPKGGSLVISDGGFAVTRFDLEETPTP